MKKTLPLNPFNNVLASGLAWCDLNNMLGSTLESINLTMGGTAFTKAMITLIQLKANGKVIWESTGSNLDLSELFAKGYAADAARLSINFMEQKGRTLNAFQVGGIDLSPESKISNLRLEVTIAGATAPTLAGVGELSEAVATPGEEALRFLMCRRHRGVVSIAATGQRIALAVPHIDPAGGGSAYKRIHFYSANMTSIYVQRNGVPDLDISVADLQFMQKKAGRAPQANHVVFDPVLDNLLSERLWDTRPSSSINQAIIYGVFSGTETFSIETEEILPLGMY